MRPGAAPQAHAPRGHALLAAALLTLAAPAAAETVSGARLDYVLHCLGCHLEDGRGAPDRVPTLEGVGRFLRVPGGRGYLVRVPGVAHAPLDDAALAALLNWMLARFDPETHAAPGFSPYDAAEVAQHRAAPLADAEAERNALLAALAAATAAAAPPARAPTGAVPATPPGPDRPSTR